MNTPIATLVLLALSSYAHAAASHKWANERWRDAVEEVVVQRLADFERAQDKDSFCPGYGSATKAQRINCWSVLVRATVKLESNDNPRNVYYEPMGYNSVGLLQLSRNECRNAPTEAQLKNAEANLICGTHKMANLVKTYSRIEGKRGAGKYWSVLRKPYHYSGMSLGKAHQIQAVTRKYKDFVPGKAAIAHAGAAAENPALSGIDAPDSPAPTVVVEAKPDKKKAEPKEEVPAPVARSESEPEEETPTVVAEAADEPAPLPERTKRVSRKPASGSTRSRREPSKKDWAASFWEEMARQGQ